MRNILKPLSGNELSELPTSEGAKVREEESADMRQKQPTDQCRQLSNAYIDKLAPKFYAVSSQNSWAENPMAPCG